MNGFLNFFVLGGCLAIANAVNTSLRQSAKGDEQPAPILPSRSTSTATSDMPSSDGEVQVDDATSTPHVKSDTSWAPQEANIVGEIVADTLMLSEEHILAVIENPDQFDNVLRFGKRQETPANMFPQEWFLALSPRSAVFFNDDGSQVWSVVPSGIPITNPALPKIQSVDGRAERIPSLGILNLIVLVAWCSTSNEEFALSIPRWPNGWGLLAREIITGRNPRVFLNWPLPYRNVREGLDQLADKAGDLVAFEAATRKWRLGGPMLKKLRELNVDEGHPVLEATDRVNKANLNYTRTLIAFLIFVGFVFALPFALAAMSYLFR